jgi:trehalose 6-phosphate phosphatase
MAELLDRFAALHADAGIFLDYDGTLSEIVRQPDQATPVAGGADLLRRLAERFKLVSIVSGRGTPELVEWLGTDVDIWGVHGAQHSVGGRTDWAPSLASHVASMAEVRDRAIEAVSALGDAEGSVVEDKGVIVALHYRPATDPNLAKSALNEIANDLVERFGLSRSDGRMVIELRPAVEFSKAAVVFEQARSHALRAVLFAGDDLVDLPAFDAVDELSASGLVGVKVAVDSPEVPTELVRRADIVVDGPRGLVELLSGLIRTE